ncbi:unnamed protein product [Didymodactylos carnosus]|uniref:Uncharacterized protein n=1 Tax=Didymodactylos carnosus TaxID=1234261 RepID=A0A813NZ37_9BILA|nr:unnamed protein product [Didymodactylos carnosus]CAF1137537.1 unnamed protein product [Didymodactylos carnosus]CAF3526327.1 unnamed protein product [Didymodactylos carnosus]CAF3927990.1 unnamed protein product [Didymodactylos carnosus]
MGVGMSAGFVRNDSIEPKPLTKIDPNTKIDAKISNNDEQQTRHIVTRSMVKSNDKYMQGILSSTSKTQEIILHTSNKKITPCSICNALFDISITDEELKNHIQSHLKQMEKGRKTK